MKAYCDCCNRETEHETIFMNNIVTISNDCEQESLDVTIYYCVYCLDLNDDGSHISHSRFS